MRKRLVFMGSSLDDLRDFPAATRRAVGFELSAVQAGLMPSDFKPMSTVGTSPGGVRSEYHGPGSGLAFCPALCHRYTSRRLPKRRTSTTMRSS